MSAGVRVSHEHRRGCGFRQPGGIYLVADGLGAPCGRLPMALDVCPTCGHGIKHSRGWTWVEPAVLFEAAPCASGGPWTNFGDCPACPLGDGHELMVEGVRAGLLWVGAKHYTPGEFTDEAVRMGVSRKVKAVPKGFELGTTWVLLAHSGAMPDGGPGVFSAFRPRAIEYVVHGDETEEQLKRLRDRGITPVDVRPIRDGGA